MTKKTDKLREWIRREIKEAYYVPSKRHHWKFLRMSERTGAVEQCLRCGRTFIEKADTTGAYHCFPTPEWLKAHPDDDKKSR